MPFRYRPNCWRLIPVSRQISETERQVGEVEEYLLDLPGVTHTTSVVGQGALRFLLTYTPEKLNSGYAQILVDVEDESVIAELAPRIEADLAVAFPGVLSYAARFQLGPGSTGKVQARFSGSDIEVLRDYATRAIEIYRADGDAKAIRTDWQNKVKVIKPVIADKAADANGIERPDVAAALLEGFQGKTVGVFRDENLLLPIIMRAAEDQRSDVASIQNLQIWSPAANQTIPLGQVVSSFETGFEDEVIMRLDRRPTLIVFGDPMRGSASSLFAKLRPQIEAIELPPDYTLEWGGEYEDSGRAREGLAGSIPIFVLVMVLVTVALFNSLRQTLVIWLNVPLALIGVTAGLLLTAMPFGFMSLLGFLSLIGMLIKNAIVLVDEINLQSVDGKSQHDAIADSAASRLRPVAMAAATTALGMIPLLLDAFFAAMAVTIIAGLVFATVLTMIVLPVFFSILVPKAASGEEVAGS